MHTFYQRYPSEHRWTKYHPLEQVIGNPSQSVRTRCQLESDAEMCMFALTTLHAYFAAEGIHHQTSIARTPEQNSVVERRNRTLVEAARTMLSAAKVPLFFWAKAIATACFTQNRSLVIPRHEKTPYHIINDQKPTRRQLEPDAEMCMFALTVSRIEPKNIKEAMADFAWIESMQEELHQFDRLD
nr:putative ribonuclease H-like domain-containing protein [Tanacetum cinerariifolium]